MLVEPNLSEVNVRFVAEAPEATTLVRPAVYSALIAVLSAAIVAVGVLAAPTVTATLPAPTAPPVVSSYTRLSIVKVSPAASAGAPVPRLPAPKVTLTTSWPDAFAPAEMSRPVAFWIACAPAAVAAEDVRAMLRPSEEDSVSAPVEASAAAVTPVWFVTALIAAAALRPWVTAFVSPATAPTEMPLMTRAPLARLERATGATPTTEFAAVAVTPVRLDLELIAVAFAVAESAVTPAAL